MTHSLTRKRSTPSLSKHESDISGVSLREGKNPAVKSRRYEQILAAAGIYMDDDDKVATTKECKALCQTLLNTNQKVPHDSLFNDDIFRRVCQRVFSALINASIYFAGIDAIFFLQEEVKDTLKIYSTVFPSTGFPDAALPNTAS